MQIQQQTFRKYFLVINESNVEVYPKGDFGFSWDLQEKDEGLYYRREFTGNMIFENDEDSGYTDYDIVKAIESDVEVEIIVKKRCSGSYSEDVRGFVDLLGSWDDNVGKLTTAVIIKDDYSEFAQNFDKEYNMFDLGLTEQSVEDTAIAPNITYDNGFLLKDIIDYIMLELDNRTYQSDFFDAVTNPVTAANPNRLNDMILYRKSDIIDPTVNAAKGIVTINKILDWCRDMFNCFPSIDSSGYFRIENRVYYDNSNSYSVARAVGIDLTTLEDGKYIRNLNRYDYDNGKVYRKEIFKFIDVENSEFAETQIEYDTVKTKDNTKKYKLTDLTTDLAFLQDKPEEASSNGFFLMTRSGGAVLLTDISFEQRAKQLNLVEDDYDTFETIGTNQITSAINNDIVGSIVITNELLQKIIVGDQYVIQGAFTMTALPGLWFPNVQIVNDKTGDLISDIKYFIDGQNNIILTVGIFVEIIELSGDSGTAEITAGGVTETITFNTNLSTTASDFVTASVAAYLAADLILTSDGEDIIFTSNVSAQTFNASRIENLTGNLIGSVVGNKGRIEILNSDGPTDFELLDISVIRNPRQNVKNGHLSWLNLLNSYFLSGRSLTSGTIFGINRTFTTSKIKMGEEIKGVPICCDAFDPEDLIRTDIGDGQIVAAKENKDGIFDFELIYSL